MESFIEDDKDRDTFEEYTLSKGGVFVPHRLSGRDITTALRCGEAELRRYGLLESAPWVQTNATTYDMGRGVIYDTVGRGMLPAGNESGDNIFTGDRPDNIGLFSHTYYHPDNGLRNRVPILSFDYRGPEPNILRVGVNSRYLDNNIITEISQRTGTDVRDTTKGVGEAITRGIESILFRNNHPNSKTNRIIDM